MRKQVQLLTLVLVVLWAASFSAPAFGQTAQIWTIKEVAKSQDGNHQLVVSSLLPQPPANAYSIWTVSVTEEELSSLLSRFQVSSSAELRNKQFNGANPTTLHPPRGRYKDISMV